MKKLELMITALCWMLWMMIYVLAAAWVGEGAWGDGANRFFAALLATSWAMFGFLVIHMDNLPRTIATALLEDDE